MNLTDYYNFTTPDTSAITYEWAFIDPPFWTPDIHSASNSIFVTIFTALALSISLKFLIGEGTYLFRGKFIKYSCLLLIITQYYHLWRASVHVPLDFTFNVNRWDCLKSEKGGKRGWEDESLDSRNICFCTKGMFCRLGETTITLDGDEVKNYEVTGEGNATTENCLIDTSATCFSFLNHTISRFIPVDRDCQRARPDTCTRDKPCHPCDISHQDDFRFYSRCRTCSARNTGECNFVEEVGPYCYQSATSRKVVPCTKCCTEPVEKHIPLFDEEEIDTNYTRCV